MTTGALTLCKPPCDSGRDPLLSDQSGTATQRRIWRPLVRYQWATDPDGIVTWVDPIRERLVGPLVPTFSVGWLDIVHPDDRARVEHTYRAAVRRHTSAAYGCRLLALEGLMMAHVTMRPKFDKADFIGFIGSTRLEMTGEEDRPDERVQNQEVRR